jgi:predicted ATPase
MLTKLRIRNFKAWKDTGELRLAPLTVFFGTNSSGKSSLGHLLLALKQTAASTDRRRALHTGDESSLIDLGTFLECLHRHDRKARLQFELEWSAQLAVLDPLQKHAEYAGTALSLDSTLSASSQDQPEVERIAYDLRNEEGSVLSATLRRSEGGKWALDAKPYKLVHAAGRKWPVEGPDKFYRVSERSLARYQNADFLAEFALEVERNLGALSYLGPLRDHPHRTYTWSGNMPPDVGQKGEFVIAAILAAKAAGRKLNRGGKQHYQKFDEFIASELVSLGVIDSFRVQSAGRKDYEVKVKTRGGLTEVALPDVGFGVSQVLPALVAAFYCEPGSTVWMEQPEIHLHPQVQAELADRFITAIRAKENGSERLTQLVIETHSEHFLNRLQRRIAEGTLSPDQVAIYFARSGEDQSNIEELQVNEYGDITNWPDNFFGDEMGDIVARTKAAAQRRAGGST